MDDPRLELDILFAVGLLQHLTAKNRQAVIDLIKYLLSEQ